MRKLYEEFLSRHHILTHLRHNGGLLPPSDTAMSSLCPHSGPPRRHSVPSRRCQRPIFPQFTAPPDGLPTHAGLAGLNASGPSASSSSADATDDNENNFTIREHVVKKPVMKKGFFNSEKAKKGVLYGEAGSGEGVLPENAGDPLGYIPKKLRQTCKIIDTNTPE